VALSKYTLFINVATGDAANPAAIRVGGWSETWYDNVALSEGQKNTFRKLCALRAALLPSTGVIVAQRYQNLDPLGPSAVELQRFPGRAGIDNDYPSLALYCRVSGSGVANTRPMYIRGVPDDFVVKGEYVPNPAYRNAVKAYCDFLEGYNFKARDKSQPNIAINSIADDGTVTLMEEYGGLVAGQMIRLMRVVPFDNRFAVNKVWKIDTVTNQSVFKVKNWIAGESGQTGSARLNAYVYPNIPADAVTLGRIVSKKPGAPFDLFRGRASAKK